MKRVGLGGSKSRLGEHFTRYLNAFEQVPYISFLLLIFVAQRTILFQEYEESLSGLARSHEIS